MKKIISVLLTIISIFTLSGTALTAFAEDTAETVISENRECHEVSDETGESDFSNEPEGRVIMYLCATAHSFTGHVWLYFINNTDKTVTIGYVDLQPGQEMSVGSLRNTRKDGGGTYYNGEAMMAAMDGKLDSLCEHTTSLKMNLNDEQIDIVSEKIKATNTYELIFCNCGIFAARVWNSVAPNKVVHIVFPVITIFFMNIAGAEKGAVRMKGPLDEDGIKPLKQNSTGVHEASPDSFNLSCVNF